MLDRGARRFGRDPYERGARRLVLALTAALALLLCGASARVGYAVGVVTGLPRWPLAAGCAAACAAILASAGWWATRG